LTRGKAPLEAEEIIQALRQTAGNKTEAAHLLGISRRTIYRQIDAHRIHFEI